MSADGDRRAEPGTSRRPREIEIEIERLDSAAFAPFGEVIETSGAPSAMINRGLCARYHDLAGLDFVDGGTAGVSLFDAEPRTLPHALDPPVRVIDRHGLAHRGHRRRTPHRRFSAPNGRAFTRTIRWARPTRAT